MKMKYPGAVGDIKINKDAIAVTTTEKGSVNAGYQEQVDRLKRSYQRLAEIDKGRTHDMYSEFYRDEIYVFFMNCHHLKDWLAKDSQFSASKTEVDDYINSNKELQICADICNAHKHFRLDEPRKRSAEQPSVGDQNIELKLKAREIVVRAKFTIDTASGPLDGFELATRCLDLWKAFILEKGGNA
jgi:hypothetical protein